DGRHLHPEPELVDGQHRAVVDGCRRALPVHRRRDDVHRGHRHHSEDVEDRRMIAIIGYIVVGAALLGVISATFFAGKKANINEHLRGRLEAPQDLGLRADPFQTNVGSWATPIIQFIAVEGVAKAFYGTGLRRSGYFSPHAPAVYMVIKICYGIVMAGVILAVPPFIWEYFHNLDPMVVKLLIWILVFFIPDYLIVYRRMKAYQQRIE